MERNYKVFISYRHLPLDMAVAKKLHTTIEHYRVPKKYQKNGEKTLGIVFRDKDELPISSNLTGDLQTALDHSEYLILICSKETQQSQWVLDEINYFLKNHDRNHILVFLVDGSMEESVPKELIEIRDQDGKIVNRIEPLAANIVAETARERKKLFKVEVLRILATLIGCSFDSLYQRNQRYIIHRMMIAAGLVTAVGLCFIGMLWNRNQKIQKQLDETKIQNSRMLALKSEQEEEAGNHTQALKDALSALPDNDDDDKPYVAEAELALSNCLSLYEDQTFQFQSSMEQDVAFQNWDVSSDGTYLVTKDECKNVSVYLRETGKLLYSFRAGQNPYLKISEDNSAIIVSDKEEIYAKDIKTGKNIWRQELTDDLDYIYPLEDTSFIFCEYVDGKVQLYSEKDGCLLQECSLGEEQILYWKPVVSPDASMLCFLNIDAESTCSLYIWNLNQNTLHKISEYSVGEMPNVKCSFTKDNRILLAGENKEKAVFLDCYKKQGKGFKKVSTTSYPNGNTQSTLDVIILDGIQFILSNDDVICIVNRKTTLLLNASDFSLINSSDFSDMIVDAKIIADNRIALVTKDGNINIFDKTGLDSEDYSDSFSMGFSLNDAEIVGDQLEDMIVVVAPDKYKNRLTSICWKENEEAIWAETVKDKDERMMYFISPDEKYTCLFRLSDQDDRILLGSLWKSNQLKNNFSISKEALDKLTEEEYLFEIESENTFLTNSGKLILDNKEVIDLENNTAESIERDGVEYTELYSCIDETRKNVVTLGFANGEKTEIDLYIDGVFQKTIAMENGSQMERVISASKDGKVYMEWVENPADESDPQYAWYIFDSEKMDVEVLLPYGKEQYTSIAAEAVAENHSYYAYVTENGDINIVDFSTGQKKCDLKDVNGADVQKMFFFEEDKYFMILSESGSVGIYDLASGRRLHYSNHNDFDADWTSDMRYELKLDEEHDRMVLISDVFYDSESFCMVFQLSSMDLVGLYNGPVHFNQEDHTFTVNPLGERLLITPFYHTDDLVNLTKKYLGN